MAFDSIFDVSTFDGSNGFAVTVTALTNASAGIAVSSAGDLNGDGINDILIGDREANIGNVSDFGKTYVIFGSSELGDGGSFDLASLNGLNGFVINGLNGFDDSGASVSDIGDLNGDGFDDLIVGAPGANANGISNSGQSYVIFGGNDVGNSGSFDLAALDGTNGFTINGAGGTDASGAAVNNAGDVNGDGIDDIIIGAPFSNASGTNSGESYVVFGGSGVGADGSFNLAALDGSNGFVIDGVDIFDRLGRSVSGAGDVNGDGFADVLVGAPDSNAQGIGSGQAYLIYGGSTVGSSGSIDPASLDGSDGIVINGGGRIGTAVSGAGDINNDGVDDFVITARRADVGDSDNAGKSYVIFGSDQGLGGTINLSGLDGSNGFVINGVNDSDNSGSAVSDAGDLNGDGIADLIIGSLGTPGSYVIFGGNTIGTSGSLSLADLDGNNGFRISDESDPESAIGFAVSGLGDVNGDGVDDVITANPSNLDSIGAAYILFGQSDGLSVINGTPDSDILIGTEADDVITGFGSADVITTGGGSDTIRYTEVSDRLDVITDFTVGLDQIALDFEGLSPDLTVDDAIASGIIIIGGEQDAALLQVDLDCVAGIASAPVTLAVFNGVSPGALGNSVNFTL